MVGCRESESQRSATPAFNASFSPQLTDTKEVELVTHSYVNIFKDNKIKVSLKLLVKVSLNKCLINVLLLRLTPVRGVN